MTSLKTSLTGWRRHTPKINSLKSDISPERLYHSRSGFSKKLMVSVGVSWSGKTDVFFIDPQKTKVDQNCYIDLLKPLSGQWLLVHARHSVLSHRAKMMPQFLRQNTPDFIAADEWASYSPDLSPSDYCIWDILQDLINEGQRLPLANPQDF